MSVIITSTTSSNEPAKTVIGLPDQGSVEEDKSAPAPTEEPGETSDESDSSDENEETETESNSDDESKEGEDKPKKNKGLKKRFAKLTGKLTAKEQEVEYWRAQALKSQSAEKQPANESASKAAAGSSEGKPSADQFDTHEAYVEALTDWKIEQKEIAKEMKAKQQSMMSEIDKQVQSYAEKQKAFAEAHDDFDDIMDSVQNIPLSMAVREVLLSADNGPELAYELAKNPKELERICGLNPIAAAREITRLEAKLAKPSESSKDIKTTKAPPPIKAVGGKSGPVHKSIYDKGISFSEYERIRNEQLKSKK